MEKEVNIDRIETVKTVTNQTSYLAWLELACVVLLNMSINLRWLTFSPVATLASQYMDVEMSAITWLANCATLIYIAMGFFTGWLFDRFGMRACVSVFSRDQSFLYIHTSF
jgi:MFS family permease